MGIVHTYRYVLPQGSLDNIKAYFYFLNKLLNYENKKKWF